MNADDLRLDIDASRRAIRQDYASLRDELDFATKTKRAVAEHPLPWLGGAAFIGYLLSGRRKQKARKRKDGTVEPVKRLTILGVLFGAARMIFPFVRPHLTAFATRKLIGFAGKIPR